MPDERRVSRHEGITVTIERLELSFVADPLPWRKRNDFGDEITQQYLSALNKAIEQNKAGLVGKLMESTIEYDKLLKLAYPSGPKDFEKLGFREIIEVLRAALDVNDLGRQLYMLDPNLPAPEPESGNESGANEDGPKITLLDDSSSQESDPVTNSND